VAQVAKHLLNKYEALISNPSTERERKRERERERERERGEKLKMKSIITKKG
jgi:hypothetical protein